MDKESAKKEFKKAVKYLQVPKSIFVEKYV